MIAAANVAPSFHARRRISSEDLPRLQEPAAIFEHHGLDSDGVPFWVYTIAGWLDGRNIATREGGCTVGGDVMVVNADTRGEADAMACMALQDSIDAEVAAAGRRLAARASLARLESIGALERMRLAQAAPADKADAFVEDAAKIRELAGDDIVLTVGGNPT